MMIKTDKVTDFTIYFGERKTNMQTTLTSFNKCAYWRGGGIMRQLKRRI